MTLRAPPEERDPTALLAFGVLNLDKPPGPSAHQVAGWIRDMADDAITEAVEAGHTDAGNGASDGDGDDEDGDAPTVDRVAHGGTLDPKVTGCLPVLLGDAARMAQVFDDAVKEYVTVLELQDRAPADFEQVLAEFEGEIYQKPPKKSAVKRQLRTREIYALDVLEREDRRALVRVRCESGTYIRKLCHDLGLALGTGAHMGDLRRTATGPFDDRDLATMHDLADALAWWAEDGDADPLRAVVAPAERALVSLPRVTIAESAAREVAHGAPVYAPGVIDVSPSEDGTSDPVDGALVACFTPDGSAVCLGRLAGDPDADAGTVVELERVLV